MYAYLCTKFQVPSVFLASFRQGRVETCDSLPPPQSKPLQRPPRLGLTFKLNLRLIFSEIKKTN